MAMRKWMLLAAGLVLGACTQPHLHVTMDDCPAAPDLPRISAGELQALSDDTYRKLVARELQLKAHITLLSVGCQQ